jgi:hypothetical protein
MTTSKEYKTSRSSASTKFDYSNHFTSQLIFVSEQLQDAMPQTPENTPEPHCQDLYPGYDSDATLRTSQSVHFPQLTITDSLLTLSSIYAWKVVNALSREWNNSSGRSKNSTPMLLVLQTISILWHYLRLKHKQRLLD